MGVYYENHTKYINTICRQNAERFNVSALSKPTNVKLSLTLSEIRTVYTTCLRTNTEKSIYTWNRSYSSRPVVDST